MPADLYAAHLAHCLERTATALEATGHDALVLHSGAARLYFADDQHVPFRPAPHFARWVPLDGPDHLVMVRPGRRPVVVHTTPRDFWYEHAPLGAPFWAERFEVIEVGDAASAFAALPASGRRAYIGPDPDVAAARGLPREGLNHPGLTARLDWERSYKTPYEVACTVEATAAGAAGHRAARAAFETGASEIEIHHAYVSRLGCIDHALPYESIVALDEKAAYLHYLGKRRGVSGRVLLVDAGATSRGYACDITRTWTRPGVPAAFDALLGGLDEVQRALCERVRPGMPYLALHREAERRIAELLAATGIVRGDPAGALERGVVRAFFPHGVGHLLGIQVHDVAGQQRSPEGGTEPPPPDAPTLRTTRIIEPMQVFTVEPGVYFIAMLLEPVRAGPAAGIVDWELVDRLAPFGGMRIEDNVVVTETGHRNLTREALPES